MDSLKMEKGILTREAACELGAGVSLPLDLSATAMYDEAGIFMGDLILFRDLTRIKSLQEEVERSARLASIGRLAAGVAHEIRNPLSSIKGFATYFKERYRQVPEDQETAEVMIREVDRLNKVITQLLEFARPTGIEKKPTAFMPFMKQSLKLVEGDLHNKGIQPDLDAQGEIEEVRLDPDRFKQVLLNLYLNAMEAMKEGGSLRIHVSKDASGENIQISIEDSGKGIRQEDLDHVFDPYFTTKSSGTGLGLAIAHRIVKAHGGDIRLESEWGKGTRVVITIPI
jgi:two-component system sensor histidine kinase HydH